MNTKDNSSVKIWKVVTILLCIIVLGLVLFILYNKGMILKSAKGEKTSNKRYKDTHIVDHKSENDSLINFDKNKCLNNDVIRELSDDISIYQSANQDGISFSTEDSNRKTVKVVVNWDILNKLGYNSDLNKSTREEYQITLDRNVEEIYGGVIDHDMSGLVYLFLLDDGSVSYITAKDILEQQKFEAKKIESIEEVVRFVNIGYVESYHGSLTVIAYKKDGNFYDLKKQINLYG